MLTHIKVLPFGILLALVGTSFAAVPARRQPARLNADAAADQPAVEPAADDPTAPKYGDPQTIRFRVGAEITAANGACRGMLAMMSVPLDCPEQQVTIVSEDFSPEVAEVTYRPVAGGEVKQMLISVPQLAAGATARAILTVEVSTRPILPPEQTEELTIPKKIPRALRMYTIASPYIETNHARIRDLSKEIMKEAEVAGATSDWEKIEAIYDAVLNKVEYVEGPDKAAIEALRDGQADCQGRSALFVAVCRNAKIPARMVWVHGHVYPEFYLERAEGEGHWYPCESAGSRAFGEMPLARAVMQKGDNFRVPERKEKLRYASDFLIGLPTPGGGKPRVKYIREIEPGSASATQTTQTTQ
jgi:hypothetical protein